MSKAPITATDFLPTKQTLTTLKRAAETCHGCPLYQKATQTVFGEGSEKAKIMLVGEIPGNKEDLTGRPFQGPAGMLLRRSVETVGLEIEDLYFTNVVKHFKFDYIKNKRMHRTPVSSEIRACLPWLEAEIHVIQPQIILCLGAIAAKALISKGFQLRKERGKWFKPSASLRVLATFHPSAILRAIDEQTRQEMKALFMQDLKKVSVAVKRHA